MCTLNVAGRKNLRNICEIELEKMLMNLSIQEKEETSTPKPHSSSVKQTAFSALQGCNLAPYTFNMTHINVGQNDIAVDFNTYNSQKQCESTNTDLKPELKNVLANCQPSNDKCAISDGLSVEMCEESWTCKDTSNSLKAESFRQKIDDTLPSCHVIKEPYWHHQNSNNYSSAEEIYEPLMNSGSSYRSNSIASPKVLESSSEMSQNTGALQSNVEVSVHDQYLVTVHNIEIKQEVISTDDGSFKIVPVKKETFLPSTDTACDSYNLQSRSTNKDAPKLSCASDGNRNTHTLNLKPFRYSDSSGVSGVKQKLTMADDNLYFELSSVKEEMDGINTSWRSYNFQSGSDHSCTYSSDKKACVPNQYSVDSKVADVKQEIQSTFVGSLDFEDSKEEMLPISNVSCISYNLRSRSDQGSSLELVSSGLAEDVTGISISDSGENPVDDLLVKESSTCEIIPSGGYNLCSRNWFNETRDSSGGNNKKYKKLKYYKKRSRYNLRPRNSHTSRLISSQKESCLSKFNPNKHCTEVQKKVIHSVTQIENQTLFVTENQTLFVTADMCCGTYNLRSRNSLGSGSSHKEGKRICSSGLHGKHKSANVEDMSVKQETPECDLNIFCRPASSHETIDLHNYSPNSYDGVQIKQDMLAHSDCTQIESEILNSSTNVSCETYNLRRRKNQGSDSKPDSLQHKEHTIINSSLGHKYESSSAEKVKEKTSLCDVDNFSRSYSLHSKIWYQEAGDICGNLNEKEKIDNDKKDEEPKCCEERSAYYLRNHCRNALCKYSESKLYRNNDKKSEKDITPRIPINCSQLHGQGQNVKGNSSVMHMTKEVMSSEKKISYHLRSRCIVKEILDQDLPFRKEIKKTEEGCYTKTAVTEKLKTVSGFLSDIETVSFDNTKNVNTRLGQQVVSNKDNGVHVATHSINNPVATREVQKLGVLPITNNNKFVKFDCSKESACKELEQEIDATCVDRVGSVRERSVSNINEINLNETICLRSGRQIATSVQKNIGNQNHLIFRDESPKQQFLQNCQSHKSFLGQEELQVFWDEKSSEETECFVSTAKDLHPPRITGNLQPCKKSNTSTEEIFYKMASGHRGSQNNSLTISENLHVNHVEHPNIHNKENDDSELKMDVQTHDTLSAFGSSYAGGVKINNQDLFVSELLGDLSWDENNAETIGTSQNSEEFPHNNSTLMQGVNSTWQHKITDSDSSVHKEQLILANNVNMIREQKLMCIDNTDMTKGQSSIGDVSHNQSVCGLARSLLNVGNLSKDGEIHETHNTLAAEDFDVNGIETSIPRKSGGDGEKLNTCVSTEVILPGICDALTTEDFCVDGASTVKISAPRKSLFTEDEKMPEDIDSQDRIDSDIDKMELYIKMPKLSLVDSSLARFVTHGMLRK